MSNGNEDKLKGMKDKVVGKVKEEYGDLTDNTSKEVEGKLQQGKGEVRERVGDAKKDVHHRVDHAVDEDHTR